MKYRASRPQQTAASDWGRKARFTMLELMVSMVLLITVTTLLVRFFANMQKAWRQTMNTALVYEDSRIAFDIITRDLQSAVAHPAELDAFGRSIRFHQPDSQRLWFVTVVQENRQASTADIEVGYRLSGTELQRAFVDSTCSTWNVFGPREDPADPPEQAQYRRIIDGVLDLQFTCRNHVLETYSPQQETALPLAVTVEITLLDRQTRKKAEKLPAAERQELETKASRTFRKTIHISHLNVHKF